MRTPFCWYLYWCLVFILVPTIICGMLFGVDVADRVDQAVIPAPVSRDCVVVSRYMITWLLAVLALVDHCRRE